MAPSELPLPPLERLSLGSSCRRCAPTGDRVPPGAEPGEEDRCALCYDVLTNIGEYQLPGEDLRPLAPTWVRICANHHAYHKVCIRWWLRQSPVNRWCPECKQPVLRVNELLKAPDGQGTYTRADGTTYVGGFKHGLHHGQGTYTRADGTTYVGEWKDGLQHGQGRDTLADGTTYVGEWKDGLRHGQGRYTFADGRTYVGEWKDGLHHGHGTYTTPDGTTYVGEWQNNEFYEGTVTWVIDGLTWARQWKDGVPMGRHATMIAATRRRGEYPWSFPSPEQARARAERNQALVEHGRQRAEQWKRERQGW